MVETSEPLRRPRRRPEIGSWTFVRSGAGSELGRPAGRGEVLVLLVLFQ